MELYNGQYYHIYNRSNNNEVVFKSEENYQYFLKNYRKYFEKHFDTIAYCLMPTHFHFLVYVKEQKEIKGESIDRQKILQDSIGRLLSSYAKAINKKHKRHGSLFQQHTKSKVVEDENHLIELLRYIHQNPLRSGLVTNIEDWEYSSYRDYVGLRQGTLPKQDLVWSHFPSVSEFKSFSEVILHDGEIEQIAERWTPRWTPPAGGVHLTSFEQEIKDFFTKYNLHFIDGTNSLEELDFTLPEYNIYFDVKEKKQHFTMSNWKETNIPEEHFFILDDLAARKVLLKAPHSFVLIRDSVKVPVYYLYSIIDLLCIPKKRVRRTLEKNTHSFKGKWLLDFRHAEKFETLEQAIKYMVNYPKQFKKIFKEEIDCWGMYEGENIQTAGIARKPKHWTKDLKEAKS